jgi:hypothetical protein
MIAFPADLRNALSVEPVATNPGHYRGELDRAWSFLLPSGGVLTSLALSAMRMELARFDVDFAPTSATATFCSAIAEGPLDIEVVILRLGRTAAQLRAHLRPRSTTAAPGDIGLEVSATFAARTNDVGLTAQSFRPCPAVPAFEDCPVYAPAATGITPPNFYRNLEVRRARGDVWWSRAWAPAEPHVSRYYRYLVPPALPDGRLDPLALPPIADTMASAVHQAVGSRTPPLIFPSLDLTLHFIAPADGHPTTPILVDCTAHAIFGSTASASAEVWQGDTLLLTATQTMTLRAIKASPR